MRLLIERLRTYKQKGSLDERFSYKFDINASIFTDEEKQQLAKEQNIFRQNVRLKELIKIKANSSYTQMDLNFWIINKWGGIQTFKRNDINIEKINKFSKQLLNSKLTQDTFSTISSLSKISSFINPDSYVIYDSRVVYAINWLIMTTMQSNLKFFPIPTSRNKKLVDFDINTIINLKYLDKYKEKEELFYDHAIAYFKFCELIKSLSVQVFDDNIIKPYYLEMLLFSIADNEIYNELIGWINIEIKNLSPL